jgi:hypothetical protein
VFAGLALVLLARLPPVDPTQDGESMYAVANSLITGPSLHVPCTLGRPAPGGCVSSFYPLLSFLMVPFALVGRLAGRLTGISPYFAGEFVAGAVPALAAAAAATASGALAGILGASRGRRVAVAVGCALGTEMFTYAARSYAESLAAACMGLLVWGVLQSGRLRYVGLVAAALGVLAKPQLGPAIVAVGIALLLTRRRWRPVIELAAATAVGALLYALYNAGTVGSSTNFGQRGGLVLHGSPDSLPVRAVRGLGVLLISPGAGLLWYSPFAVVGLFGLWRLRGRPAAALGIAASLALLGVYVLAPYGNGWGTRYLVPALPLLCAGVGCLPRRAFKIAIGVAALTFVTQAPNLVAYYEATHTRGHFPRYWSVPHSHMVQVWPAAVRQMRLANQTDPRLLVRFASRHSHQGGLLYTRTIAQWWWLLPAAGIPAYLGAAVAVALALLGGVCLRRAARGPPVGARA